MLARQTVQQLAHCGIPPAAHDCRALQEPAGADQLLGLLSTLLDVHSATTALQQRSLRGTQALLCQLAVQVAAAWRSSSSSSGDSAGSAANDLLAAHPGAPPEVVAALTAAEAISEAAVAAAVAAAQPGGGDLDAALAVLRGRQEALVEELQAAADLLRFWGRRGEKAAAGEAVAGREGDVPPMMAQVRVEGMDGRGWTMLGTVCCTHHGRPAHCQPHASLKHPPHHSARRAHTFEWCAAGAAAAVGSLPRIRRRAGGSRRAHAGSGMHPLPSAGRRRAAGTCGPAATLERPG